MARDIIREEARLVILTALRSEFNHALAENGLQLALDMAGINKPREWLREELRYLDRLEAVKLVREGSVVIAELTRKGIEHLERRLIIEGIKRPGYEE